MLISVPHKKIVLNLGNPERVTSVIPTAKVFQFKGRDLIAVPHKIEETKVLRNLGFDVPSPILHHYEWPRGFTANPFDAQKETAAMASLWRRGYILNDMGTGKTLAALWAYDYMRRHGYAIKLLVSAPLSTLERVWADEIFRNFPDMTCAVVHGSRGKRYKLLKQDVDVYIVNHDGIKVVVHELADRPDINLVIVDELSSYRNSATDKWKAMNTVINKQGPRMAWGMTGAVRPTAPTDAYAQGKLITPGSMPPYFSAFRDMTMRKVSTYKWVEKPEANDVVYAALQPAVRFTRDQCMDLPETMFVTRHVSLTTEQMAAYKEMKNRLRFEYGEGQILAVNEGVKMSKLIQIATGAAYTAEHDVIEIPVGPRIEAVKEIIEQAGTKVIVFVPLVGGLNLLAREIAKDWATAIVHGGVSKSARDQIFRAFQQEREPRVLVANAQTMSHGLTLTEASTIIWYAPARDNDIFDQANHRIIRAGQKNKQFIVMLEGIEEERRIYARHQAQQTSQGILMEMMETNDPVFH